MTDQNREQEKKREVLAFLHTHVFDPVLDSAEASKEIKQGIRLTIMRMQERDAAGIVHYFWSAVVGTERSTAFARQMREAGFIRFEEVIEPFRNTFNDRWLRS